MSPRASLPNVDSGSARQPDAIGVRVQTHTDDVSPALAPRDALRWAARELASSGIDSHAREARILLRHVLGCSEESLAGGGVANLAPAQLAAYGQLVARRRRGEPIAYIVGKKEFFGLDFAVDRRVLIPRPETEMLVAQALALFDGSPETPSWDAPLLLDAARPRIADIGTGSGAIAVSIVKHLPRATVYATDVSADALAVARANAEAHGVADAMVFSEGRFLRALPRPVQVIVCNPPYIPHRDIPKLERDVRDYEPQLALAGGADGLAAYREIFADLPRYLLPGGSAIFEIGFDMAARLTALARRHLPDAHVDVQCDLAGFDRVLRISRVRPLHNPSGNERIASFSTGEGKGEGESP